MRHAVRHVVRLLTIATIVATTGCGEKKSAAPDSAVVAAAARAVADSLPDGESRLAVPGGRVWYKRSGTKEGIPVILLHGGPGFSSYYLKPLEALGDERPVVRYDQLGGGKSDRISDTAMYNIAHFVAELDSLRSHLGYKQVHLLGHSWGTILAVEYYKVHPDHVASLTLSSAALDIPAWEHNTQQLVKTLSDSSQKAIKLRESEKKFDAPDYKAAIDEFYGKYVWRHPIASDLDSTMNQVADGIYNYMQGPSEFTITGTLRQYNSTSFLKSIKVPTLFTVGEFDEADPATIKKHAAMTPGARVEVLKGAAHITPWDNPTDNIRVVRDFLHHADSLKVKP